MRNERRAWIKEGSRKERDKTKRGKRSGWRSRTKQPCRRRDSAAPSTSLVQTSSPPRGGPSPSCRRPPPPAPPLASAPTGFTSVAVDSSVWDISHQRDHIACGLLCPAFLTQRHVCEAHPRGGGRLRGSPLGWWVSALRPFSRPSHSRCVRKGSAFCLGAVGADAGPWAASRVFLSVARGLASLAQRSPAFPLLVPRSWSSALCLGSGVQGCPSCHTGSFCAPACRHLERPPWTTLWVNSRCTR